MSPQLYTLIGILIAIVGAAAGYYVRLLVSLGKRGTVELEIKEMLSKAREEAKRITLEAENKSISVMQE